AAILPNFGIMTRLPLFICLPTKTSNEAPAGISRPLSRDISRYGKSEDRWTNACRGQRPPFLAMRSLSQPGLVGLHDMEWADYLRDEAAKYRRLAEQTDDPVIKNEMLELASVCEEVANNIEDRLTGG